MQYKVLITSTLGNSGDIVELADSVQTKQRLERGIVCEVKVLKAEETKSTVRKGKK